MTMPTRPSPPSKGMVPKVERQAMVFSLAAGITAT